MGDLIVKRGTVSIEYGNLSNTNGTITWVAKINPDNSYNIWSADAGDINFSASNTILASVKSNGNVVIGNGGTDGMLRSFSVYGIGQFSDRLKVGSTGTSGTDATVVIDAGNGGFNRLNQWVGSGGIALNLMNDGTNWYSWGIDSSHRWNITPNAITFGVTGFQMNTTGYCSIGMAPDTTNKLLVAGGMKAFASVPGSYNFITSENGSLSGNAQAVVQAISTNITVMGATASTWSVAGGADWEILNGGASYLDSVYANGLNLTSSNASGSIKFLTGGVKNTNIRCKISSTGKWAINYGDTTTATEVIQVKAGNIKLDGTTGTHGIIFPDGTNQKYPFVVAGSTGTVQFNNGSNVLGGDTLLTWDNSTKRLGVNVAAPTEKLHVKTGNIRIEGTLDTHGIIFPNSVTQYRAYTETDYSGWSLAYITSNADQDVSGTMTQYAVAIGPIMFVSFHYHITSFTSIGTGSIKFDPPYGATLAQRIPATITDGFDSYPAMWDTSSGFVYYTSGGLLAEVTTTDPFSWDVNSGINVAGSYFYL